MYIAQTQQKRGQQDGFSDQPSKRERARFSSISSPSAIVQRPVKACPNVACTGPSHYAHTGSSLQRSSTTQLRLAIACLETQCRNMLPHRCLVEVFGTKVARVLRSLLPSQQNLFLSDVFLEPTVLVSPSV